MYSESREAPFPEGLGSAGDFRASYSESMILLGADGHGFLSGRLGAAPAAHLKHVLYNFVDEEILNRLHVVGERGQLPEDEAPLANLILLYVAFVLGDRSLLRRQVALRGDQRDRQRPGPLVIVQLFQPLRQTIEALL